MLLIHYFSLYPDSPIFSTKEYDWENSVLFENVFVTPDIEETFSGTIFNGHPAFIERVKNEGLDQKTLSLFHFIGYSYVTFDYFRQLFSVFSF